MVEVRRLRGASEPPVDTWVMVERRDGAYHATGKAHGQVLESPGGFADRVTAMQVALEWADYLGLDHLYIKERRSRRL